MCELPLSICRIQWLAMQGCLPAARHQDRYDAGFRRLCEAIEGEHLDLQGGQARLHSLHESPLFFFAGEIDRHLARALATAARPRREPEELRGLKALRELSSWVHKTSVRGYFLSQSEELSVNPCFKD